MYRRSRMIGRSVLGLTLLLPLAAQFACNKSSVQTGSGSNGASDTSAAIAVFTANCSKCHSINGTGAKRGPDLTHVGADSEHTVDWLAEFINNPGSKKPGSRMPAFEGKISDSDLKSLTEYLVSLK